MVEAYRLLKQDRVAVMFYGWTRVDAFFQAWRDAGFIGHLVFRKSYSSKSRFLRYQHEQAFLLAKGRPPLPKQTATTVESRITYCGPRSMDCCAPRLA